MLALAVLRAPSRGERRTEVLVAVALIAVAGVVGHLVLCRHVSATQNGGGATRVILIFGLCTALAAMWLPIRAFVRGRCRPRAALVLVVGLTVALLAVAATITPEGTPQSHAAPQPYPLATSATARIHLWKAALDAWRDRPLLGAGATAYYQASAKYQASHPSLFAHNLPLELAAELGTLGLLLGIALYAATIDLLRRARSPPALWLLGPAVAAFLAANLYDWPWHLAGLTAAWAVAAGALLAGQSNPTTLS